MILIQKMPQLPMKRPLLEDGSYVAPSTGGWQLYLAPSGQSCIVTVAPRCQGLLRCVPECGTVAIYPAPWSS